MAKRIKTLSPFRSAVNLTASSVQRKKYVPSFRQPTTATMSEIENQPPTSAAAAPTKGLKEGIKPKLGSDRKKLQTLQPNQILLVSCHVDRWIVVKFLS
jgi:hypothetical protein